MRILPVLLLYLIIIGILYVGAEVLGLNWIIYLIYRYRLILTGIAVFLAIFAVGEISNLRRR